MDNDKIENKLNINDKDVFQMLWNYFVIHGNQRLIHINYYIALSSALIVLQLTIIGNAKYSGYISYLLGILESILSFIFYKIDERTKFLVKHAEDSIKIIENYYNICGCQELCDAFKIFTTEEIVTTKVKEGKNWLVNQYSHRVSYNFIMVLFSYFSIAIGIVALLVSK